MTSEPVDNWFSLLKAAATYTPKSSEEGLSPAVLSYQDWQALGGWPVRSSYILKEGSIVGSGMVKGLIFPTSNSEVLLEFQRLSSSLRGSSGEGEIISFLNRWGSMGYSALKAGEPTAEAVVEAESRDTSDEPVDWFKAHVGSVYLACILLAAAKSGTDEDLAQAIDQVPNPIVFASGATTESWDYQHDGAPGQKDSKNLALSIATRLIESNVAGIRIAPTANYSAMQVGVAIRFNALIEAIWWHVLKLGERPNLRACRECRSVFAPTRSNQYYCPAPSHARSEISLCAARQRMRAYRNKKTGEK